MQPEAHLALMVEVAGDGPVVKVAMNATFVPPKVGSHISTAHLEDTWNLGRKHVALISYIHDRSTACNSHRQIRVCLFLHSQNQKG